MTESQWQSCTDTQAMLAFLHESDRANDRKLNLFGVACCRRIWPLLMDERSRNVVEAAERYAEGNTTAERLEVAWRYAYYEVVQAMPPGGPRWWAAVAAVRAARAEDQQHTQRQRVASTVEAAALALADEGGVQAALLRDLIGPEPFRPLPSLAPSVLAWNDGCIVKLATSIYEERTLPQGTLDVGRLGVLADALEDAGVTDRDILGHCRQQGAVHVRGCWLLDLLLGKE
jgi:hypothetical protein